MAGSCCENEFAIDVRHGRQKRTLVSVLWINLAMFLVIAMASVYGHSSALLSDSLDNLGDALTYGLSLYVASMGTRAKARVAMAKGVIILVGASAVVWQVVWKLSEPVMPSSHVMGIFSIAGVVANGACLWLLWQHRNEDVNMSSVFECSRNDIASNLSVFVAAVAVAVLQSGWPDIIVAALLAAYLYRSAVRVMIRALQAMHDTAGEVENGGAK